MMENTVGKILVGAENAAALDVKIHLGHVQQGRTYRQLEQLGKLLVRHHGLQVRQVQVGIEICEFLQESEDGLAQIGLRVALADAGLFHHVFAVNGGAAVGGAQAGEAQIRGALADLL